MRIRFLALGLICLFFIFGCEKPLPTSPDIGAVLDEYDIVDEEIQTILKDFLKCPGIPQVIITDNPTRIAISHLLIFNASERDTSNLWATNIVIHLELPGIWHGEAPLGIWNDCMPPGRSYSSWEYIWYISADVHRLFPEYITAGHWKIWLTWDTAKYCD